MWVCWVYLALASLAFWPATSENAGVDGANETGYSDDASLRDGPSLSDWIEGLVIQLPGNTSVEMPENQGRFTLRSGYCTGIKVGRLESEDLSSGLILKFGVRVSGLGISCFIDGDAGGAVQINITLEGSSLNSTLLINPYHSDMVDLPLPMGPVNMSNCSADLEVTKFTSAGNTSKEGSLAQTLFWMGDMMPELIHDFVSAPLCEGLTSFVQEKGTAAMQEGSNLVSMLLLPPFPNSEPTPLKAVVDWADYPPVGVVKALLAERFTLFTDKLMDILDLSSLNSTLVARDDIHLVLSNLSIEGLGGEHRPSLELTPDQSSIRLAADLAGMTLRSAFELSVSMPESPTLTQEIDLTLGLRQAALAVRAMVDREMLDNLKLDDALSSPKCYEQCMEGATDPPEEALAIEDFHVELRPLFEVSSRDPLAGDGTRFITMLIAALYRAYLPSLNALVNGALGISRSQIDELLWQNIKAAPPCGNQDKGFVLSEAGVQCLWSVTIFITLLGLPFAAAAKFLWNPHRQGPAESEHASQESAGTAAARDVSTPSSASPRCLACEPCVPRALAVYYPFAVLAVMVLFLYADLDVGTTVTMVMAADGESSQIGPLFSFSLVGTIAHAWNSKAYFIAVLTVIASGVWPLVKLSLLLVAWLVPPRCLAVGRRGKILDCLDTWGKYSFLDSWFLVVTISAFALEWQGAGMTSLKIETSPATAFYAFFVATLLSLVLGHVASEFHRCAAKAAPAAKVMDGENQTNEAAEGTRGGTEAQAPAEAALGDFAATSNERLAVLGSLIISLLLTFLGTFLTSFSFKVRGLVPEFLFGEPIEKSYSLLSVGMSVASGRYSEIGLISLEFVFVAVAVGLPFVLLGLLCVLWLAPLELERQRSLLHMARFMDAWASLDVAAVVLAVTQLEFARLAQWLVYAGNFAAPCQMVKDLTKDECLMIEFSGLPALGALFLAGLALLIVPKVSMRRFQKAIVMRSSKASAKADHASSSAC